MGPIVQREDERLNRYEALLIINPDLDESETEQVVESAKTAIESNGGQILRVDIWGRKKLAYSIKGHRDGYYVLLIFDIQPVVVRELNNLFQINESIIRHIIVCFEGDLDKINSPSDVTSSREGRGGGRPGRRSEDDDDGDDDDF
jgi:small subunit ribosomal protein S6